MRLTPSTRVSLVGAGIAAWFTTSVCLVSAFALARANGFRGADAPWLLQPQVITLWTALPILVPATAAFVAVRREFGLRTPLGSGLALFLGGVVSWAMGNVMWFYYSSCDSWPILGCGANVQIPFPSPADVLFLGIYPFCLAASIQLARAFGLRPRHFVQRVRAPLILAAVTLLVGIPPTQVAGMRVGHGQLVAPDSSTVDAMLVAAYMFGDIVLIWILLVLADAARQAAGGRFGRPLFLLVTGLGSLYVADLLFFHSLAVGTYSEVSITNVMYAATLSVLPYAVYRFTFTSTGHMSAAANARTEPWHAAADAVVAAHSRMLGRLAWQLAEDSPGVSVRGDELVLALPYERSMRQLVMTCCVRTGPLGRRLVIEALDRVLATRPEPAMQQFREELSREATVTVGTLPPGTAMFAGASVLTAVGAALFGVAVSDGSPGLAAMTHGAPVAIVLLLCGILARRGRVRLEKRRQEVLRANQTLGAMLEAFDGARQEERKRVAGEIHDFALQQLVGAVMHVDRALQYRSDMLPKARVSTERVETLLHGSIDALRRIMDGLQPSSLLHGDLRAALAEVAVQVESAYSVHVSLDAVELDELPLAQQLLAYRATAELVTNAGKHSGGSSVTVTMRRDHGMLHLSVEDDGHGFGQEVELLDGLPPAPGWGLRMLLERVLQGDGHMSVASSPGAGTRIDVALPILVGSMMGAA